MYKTIPNIVLVTLICVATSVSAQSDDPIDTVSTFSRITVEASVDRTEAYVGDLINYQVLITYDSTSELIPPSFDTSLSTFDVKDYNTDQFTRLDDGLLQSKSNFVLRVFATGEYVITPISAIFNLPDGTQKTVMSEEMSITVISLLGTEADSADIKPLKSFYEFQKDLSPYYTYGGGTFLVILIIVLLVIRKIRRKSVSEVSEELVDPRKAWEIAFEKLALLSEQNMVAQEQYNMYYVHLTEIVRQYLGLMYNITVLEMTTNQFLEAFVDIELPGNLYDEIKPFFIHADLVKFACLEPEKKRPMLDFDFVHSLVESLRVDFERKLQEEMQIVTSSDETPE